MHADGDKQRGSTNFWSFVVLQLCLYQTVWFAAGLSLMEPKCCSVSVGVRGCVACANTAKRAQCLPCSRSQTSVQRLLKTKDPANRVLGVSRGVKLLTSFPVRVCGRRPLCQVPSAMACVWSKDDETRSTLLCYSHWVLVFGFIPTALARHNLARVQYEYVLAAQLQSTCSEGYTSEDPRALSARTGFRKGLHQIELLCRAGTTKLQKFVQPRCLSPSACIRHMHGAAFASRYR